MKLIPAALVSAALLAGPAAAQSLEQTHERVWMPSGKTPMLIWRMRDRPQAPAAHQHHQAGKGQMPVRVAERISVRR